MLSEASGLESQGEDERAITSPTTLPRRTRTQLKLRADVNVLQDGESSSDYENISSDESDGVGICDDDRDSGGEEFYDEGDEVSDTDAVEMDEAFLASLHVGGDGAVSRSAVKERTEALRAMQWTPASAEFETDTPSWLGSEEARPVGELLDAWWSPLLTLFYFMPKPMRFFM
uniref:PiggyBac transposable element-derived protein domain-containing protein n=1 Tax=Phytophthora ramorum TaxID=164328 RepID=H3GXG1_PHYRM